VRFVIEETFDPDLCRLGLVHKVVQYREDGVSKVVGFFSDYIAAVTVRDSLAQTNGTASQ
jgi:hypothetical protein